MRATNQEISPIIYILESATLLTRCYASCGVGDHAICSSKGCLLQAMVSLNWVPMGWSIMYKVGPSELDNLTGRLCTKYIITSRILNMKAWHHIFSGIQIALQFRLHGPAQPTAPKSIGSPSAQLCLLVLPMFSTP